MTPLIVDVVPNVGAIAAIVTGSEWFFLAVRYVTTALSFIPMVNAVSTILFIKCYRHAVFEIARCLMCCCRKRSYVAPRELKGCAESGITTQQEYSKVQLSR